MIQLLKVPNEYFRLQYSKIIKEKRIFSKILWTKKNKAQGWSKVQQKVIKKALKIFEKLKVRISSPLLYM